MFSYNLLFKFHEMKKENIMFNKTILALSLLGVASHGAASTLASVEVVLTPQAATTLTSVSSNDVVLTTAQASIASGAIAKFTFSKAPTNAAAISTSVSTNGTTVNGNPTTCGALSYSGASNSGKTLNYTTNGTTAAGCTITLGATVKPAFAIADVSSTPISVTASFTDVGDGIDPATIRELITQTSADQYSLNVSQKADAIVDVNSLRYDFSPDADDTIVFNVVDLGGTQEVDATANAQNGTITGATLTGVTYVIDGNFAWAENIAEDPAVAGFQLAAGAVSCSGGGGVTEGTGVNLPTATSYTFTTVSAAAVTCTLSAQANSLKIALPTDDFDISATVAFNDTASTPVAGTLALGNTDAGIWGINGASVKVFAVPFGAEVEYGNSPVTVDLGNVEASANKYINLIGAMTAAGNKPAFGRADVTFTVNAPASDITFTAGYTTAAGRANLFMVEQANISTITNASATDSACAKNALAAGNSSAVTQTETAVAKGQIKFEAAGC
jgi:hypothetical protein